ncbi:MAG: hypothetical protein HKM89_12135 [Gemmatimonadales bacterium]|nr:hypothetical protein [Gemmatimonadales bacterium]
MPTHPPPNTMDVPQAPAGWLGRLRDDALLWARGRSWLWRAPLLLYVAYAGFRHVADTEYRSIFSGITFGVHELGHLVFAFFGPFLSFAGGSIAQLLLPIAAGALLLRHRDYFGMAVTGGWLSMSLAEMAVYMADAREQALVLLGFGPDPEHDWYYLLSALGLLEHDTALADLTRLLALVILVVTLTAGVWLCRVMAQARGTA